MNEPIWRKRHNEAVLNPWGDEERIHDRVLMVGHLASIIVGERDWTEETFGMRVAEGIREDLIDAMEKVAGTVIELLNGPTGRLDPGTIDTTVRELVTNAGGDGYNL